MTRPLPELGEVAEEIVVAAVGRRAGQVLEGAAVEEQRRGPVRPELLDQADDEDVVAGLVHVPGDAPEVRTAAGQMRHAVAHLPADSRSRLRPAGEVHGDVAL